MIRRESIFLQAGVLILLGLAVGAVDAFVLRRVRLDIQAADPNQFLNAPVPPKPAPEGGAAVTPDSPKPAPAPQPGDTESPKPAVPAPAPQPPPQPVEAPKPAAAENSNHITMEQAFGFFQRVDAGQAFFVDARKFEIYEQGHVASAIPMNLKSFDAGDPPQLTLMDRTQPVVVYCGGGDCDESVAVARMLNGSGFKAVFIMHDGFPAWQQRNYPVETGKHPLHDAVNFR